MMEHKDNQRAVATDIALRAGVLVRCEFHETVYDALAGDDAAAHELGNSLFSSGELKGVFSDREEMTDAIQAAIDEAGPECYSCAKSQDG